MMPRRTISLISRPFSSTVSKPASKLSQAISIDALPISEKISTLCQQISKLDLIEASQLSKLLKETLNLPDTIAAAPMPSNSSPSTGNLAAEQPVKQEKTEFKVVLQKFEAASKAKVIREIKSIMKDLNLVQAKAFVEGAPKTIHESINKEEAEKLKAKLEGLGATIVLE